MESPVTLNSILSPAEDVVAREIEGELIIVPLISGIGDADDELYTLNPTGHSIWRILDGRRSLQEVAALLADEYDAPAAELENDVLGLAGELTRRGILTVVVGS